MAHNFKSTKQNSRPFFKRKNKGKKLEIMSTGSTGWGRAEGGVLLRSLTGLTKLVDVETMRGQ